MSSRLSWTLLVVWAVVLLAAMLAYGQRQLSVFDPESRLLYASTNPDFDQRVVSLLNTYGITGANIVHIGTQSQCYCEWLTTAHQTQLINTLDSAQYRIAQVTIEALPALQQLLPSIPALIVIDDNNQLRYLGPYSTGYGCFTGKTLVQEIAAYTTQLPYTGAVINTDAEGCFCSSSNSNN